MEGKRDGEIERLKEGERLRAVSLLPSVSPSLCLS
jgi:hypothetical protein